MIVIELLYCNDIVNCNSIIYVARGVSLLYLNTGKAGPVKVPGWTVWMIVRVVMMELLILVDDSVDCEKTSGSVSRAD